MTDHNEQPRANKTDAGNGSKAICRVSNVLHSPSPDPGRSAKMKSIIAALCFALVLPSLADDEAKWYPYNRQFDKKVTVQGVAWGLRSKGLGVRVMTADGIPFYFDPKDIKISKGFERWQGRLIEVTGILRKRMMNAAPIGAQGYGEAFEYLVVEGAKIRGIDKIEDSLAPKAEQDGGGQPATRPESK